MAKTYARDGFAARGHFCPEHGYPLMSWGRVGKLECPVRWCPYVEPHEGGVETVEDPGYASGDEDDSYNDEFGGQGETIDGMD